ncbi:MULTISPECIES: tRNA pseudouridine(13) synthase TruD [unclassified Haladaptatus]|uniref:tRNA pseudouridine(13) synthase TruD n=1 Tax=unclassified Haladaptatus TaxID=2622732 RepID=UPI00209BFD8A|nr:MULTISPECIES: tRNA pseudouridine(13) synthase TruD [unclassified Haladaptatus]MCO8244645.1 tRNA pseudouridine(13) synthase TruD [Haladaptatus sp. AB643]MCO8253733.1 tRNA pseudouridine(13) synthase TruD [Haladaptatus sp. AB618]
MREAHPIERVVGMEYYVSDADGVGGTLRETNEDFRVREIERFDAEPMDSDTGSYPYLVVRATLHGWDTNDFARSLSSALGISRERVSWAGTKDKRAVTTQLFSLRKVDPGDLPEMRAAELEPVGRAGRELLFGDLVGNEFEITVSNPDRPENADDIADQLREFAGGEDSLAVPNFFGQQRFGSLRPITHEVGLHVVREEWEDAVMAYVGNPFETEPDDTREARQRVEDRAPDWDAVLDALPNRLGFERSMAHRLVENGGTDPEDFRDALESLPTNLQRLLVNAAQSYVFNRILSERLRRGLPFDKPVAGDVVCFAEEVDGFTVPDMDRQQTVSEKRVRTIERHCRRGRAFVTAPLVGTETELAEGEQGDIEREILDDLDLEPHDFNLPGEFHSTGTRRAILLGSEFSLSHDPLSFAFSLPSGSYATVFLREFLKENPLEMG